MNEHTGGSYNTIAETYAARVDTKPIMLHYERPAFISLLPDVTNKNVLDAGCGTGWCSAHMLSQGATVTAFDLNETFVQHTRSKLGNQATILQADLTDPLEFADASFDVITCSLVMHYVRDWLPVFKEFARVLTSGGTLVFSTHHPFMDWQEFQTGNYFELEELQDTWDVGEVRFYRRSLTQMSQDLHDAGFMIQQLLEPQPLESLRSVDADLFEKLRRNPWRLMIRARHG